MLVHGIMCSYLGNGEVDIGVTSRWLLGFVDTLFFFDSNYGEAARKYAVDYAKTFPEAKFAYHDLGKPSIIQNSGLFRKEAFDAAKKAWNYADTDWVIFIDASESLSVNVPRDHLTPPGPGDVILPYLHDEAAAAPSGIIKFPFFVFLQQGTPTEVTYDVDPVLATSIQFQIDQLTAQEPTMDPDEFDRQMNALLELQTINRAVYWTNTPKVQSEPASLSYDRMFLVSKAPTLDWSLLDASGGVGEAPVACGIVSYAYARNPNAATEAEDEWFPNRVLTQQFRNVGLSNTWATADPAGVTPSPSGFAACPAYCYRINQHDFGQRDELNAPILTTLDIWTGLFRQNPRDGVWYIDYDLGPVPVDPVTQDPSVVPDVWDGQPVYTTGPNQGQPARTP